MKTKTKTSLKEIAQATGFSLSTVSRALTGEHSISTDTRRQVRSAAEQMGYAMKRRNVIIIPPSLWYSPYYTQMISGISMGLSHYGFSSIVLPFMNISELDSVDFFGAVSLMNGDEVGKLWNMGRKKPLISVNSISNLPHVYPRVSSNDQFGMGLLVNYLVKKGHKRIARIGGPYTLDKENWSAVQRNRIYDDLADRNGLEKSMLYGPECELKSIMELLNNCLERNVTALLVLAEDYMLPILYAVRMMRIKVPEELTIVGWYYEFLCQYLERNFYGITHDYMTIGQKTAELMDRLFNGEKPTEDIFVDYHVSDSKCLSMNS